MFIGLDRWFFEILVGWLFEDLGGCSGYWLVFQNLGWLFMGSGLVVQGYGLTVFMVLDQVVFIRNQSLKGYDQFTWIRFLLSCLHIIVRAGQADVTGKAAFF